MIGCFEQTRPTRISLRPFLNLSFNIYYYILVQFRYERFADVFAANVLESDPLEPDSMDVYFDCNRPYFDKNRHRFHEEAGYFTNNNRNPSFLPSNISKENVLK